MDITCLQTTAEAPSVHPEMNSINIIITAWRCRAAVAFSAVADEPRDALRERHGPRIVHKRGRSVINF